MEACPLIHAILYAYTPVKILSFVIINFDIILCRGVSEMNVLYLILFSTVMRGFIE